MSYIVNSGDIKYGILYQVDGMQSVVYNGITYDTGERFRGILNIKIFTYSGIGSQALSEVSEFTAGSILYAENSIDQPVYKEFTKLAGCTIEYSLNDAEKTVRETTKIRGFAVELVDYPFYSFDIIEQRL